MLGGVLTIIVAVVCVCVSFLLASLSCWTSFLMCFAKSKVPFYLSFCILDWIGGTGELQLACLWFLSLMISWKAVWVKYWNQVRLADYTSPFRNFWRRMICWRHKWISKCSLSRVNFYAENRQTGYWVLEIEWGSSEMCTCWTVASYWIEEDEVCTHGVIDWISGVTV